MQRALLQTLTGLFYKRLLNINVKLEVIMEKNVTSTCLKFDFSVSDNGQPVEFQNPLRIITTYNIDEIDSCFLEIQKATREGYYAAGYVSYEAAPAFNSALQVKQGSDMPLIWFGIFERALSPTPAEASDYTVKKWKPSITIDNYNEQIEKIHERIKEDKTEQVNFTLKMKSEFKGDSQSFYKDLIQAQAADYTAYLDIGRFKIVSASPELFFKLEKGVLTTKPMAGTATRGKTYEEDLVQAQWLKHSKKNQQENNIIVKAMENELKEIADNEEVRVVNRHSIEKYPTVYQMTTTLIAELSSGTGLLDVFKALFPCGSITGLPKKETMDVISEIEQETRDVYCGAIGYITPDQEAIFNVPIRTAVVDTQTNEAVYGVGGGITFESSAEEEYEEVLAKAAILHTKQPDYQLLESLRLEKGKYFLLDEHLNRLKQTAVYFDIIIDSKKIEESLYSFAKEHPQATYKVRLSVNKHSEHIVEGSRISNKSNTQPATVKLADQPINKENIFHYHKTTYREIYEIHRQEGVYDVLLWNDGGEITEFTNGNIVVELNGKLLTPPVLSGLLPGTFREHLINEGTITEQVLTFNELKTCNNIWFINSVRKWVPVALVDH